MLTVIIFDALVVVNQIAIKKYANIKTCKDFSDEFNEIILSASQGFDEIRIIFDKYMTNSLKTKTRCDRTSKIQVQQYLIEDNTCIKTRKLLNSSHSYKPETILPFILENNL